jgi:outer membrane protein assembly factor BamC
MSGDTGQTVWVPRPADPELEAEFLARLMLRLGATEEQAKSAVANPVVLPARAKLVKGSEPGEAYIQATEGFDRTWRRVGLALDRVGFTVEDRDRSNGLYFVRYIDQDKVKTKKKGWFFSSSDDEPDVSKQRYRVLVKGDEGASQVSVLDNDGKPERSSTGTKILALLLEQLK